MAKISGGRRLLTEDFNKEDQQLVQKLAFVLNPFLEQVINALAKNLTVTENLNMNFKDVIIEVDGSGVVTNTASFQTQFSRISGINVITHQVLTVGASPYPTQAPYCTFKQNGNIVTIQHVTGLSTGTKYSLKLLIIGS